jgi:sigma-B regulation protein RsbU (phosphoserine phosphatase)
MSILFTALAGGSLGVACGLIWRQRSIIRELKTARERVVTEEARVFDFLHGLGEALNGTARRADLHELIVRGVLRILGAQSGGLYLVGESGKELHPSFVSRGCPPLVNFPLASAKDLPADLDAMQRHLRLKNVRKGEGVLAEVWESGKAQILSRDDDRLDVARQTASEAGNVAVAPLLYGGRCFGVLIVARGDATELFSSADGQVLSTLAEQSAFTLRSAEVFSEAAEKRRIDHDLQVAYEIQRILLPSKAPKFQGYDLAGINVPARHVSGDYYDFLNVDSDHCGVVIGDVSGKGVPASLIMATCRSVIRSVASGELSPASVLKKVNAMVFPDMKEDMFISMAYVLLHCDDPKVVLSRAGHDAPFLYRAADKSCRRVNPPGMAVGIDGGSVFNRVTNDFALEMSSGDCLILYTDGVTEALDSSGEEFGVENVTRVIVESAPMGADMVVERLTAELKKFVGEAPQHDDITLIAICKK